MRIYLISLVLVMTSGLLIHLLLHHLSLRTSFLSLIYLSLPPRSSTPLRVLIAYAHRCPHLINLMHFSIAIATTLIMLHKIIILLCIVPLHIRCPLKLLAIVLLLLLLLVLLLLVVLLLLKAMMCALIAAILLIILHVIYSN